MKTTGMETKGADPYTKTLHTEGDQEAGEVQPDEEKSVLIDKVDFENQDTDFPLVYVQSETETGKDDGVQTLIMHEVGELNLYLLRNVYDAFEDKGDRIVANFREDTF